MIWKTFHFLKRQFFSLAKFVTFVWRRDSDQNDHEEWKSDNETLNPKNNSWFSCLESKSNTLTFKNNSQTH